MSTRRNLIWICAAWPLLAAAILLGLGSINLPILFEIARNPVATEATVASTDCANHMTVYYRYNVNSNAFTGRAGLSKCRSLEAGDKIPVYFSGRTPSASEARDPRDALNGELVSVGLAAFFLSSAIIGLIFLRLNRARKPLGI
jgi:hypothetical protein